MIAANTMIAVSVNTRANVTIVILSYLIWFSNPVMVLNF